MTVLHQRSKERVAKLGEVFTADREVNAMLDLLPDEIWSDVSKTFLEPSCGNGNFLVAILSRKLDIVHRSDVPAAEKVTMILAAVKSIYAVDLMLDNVTEARARLQRLANDALFKVCMIGRLFLRRTDHASIYHALRRNIVVGDMLKDEKAILERWQQAA